MLLSRVNIGRILILSISIISIKVRFIDLNCLVILTGDAGVGKSNYLLRYVRGIFENAPATIGVEFAYKVSYLKNGTKVKS
jgi:GTPase SAR1 family protein